MKMKAKTNDSGWEICFSYIWKNHYERKRASFSIDNNAHGIE